MDTKTIQELRNQTGAGIVDCKRALEESGGDLAKAIEFLRKRGQKIAASKTSRTTNEGLIEAYIHPGGKVGVMVEITCETDFVARGDDFRELAHNVAMHVAAARPLYLVPEDVPQEVIDKEKEIYAQQLEKEKKPAEMIGKITEGKIQKYFQEVCLVKQPFVKDDKMTIGELVTSVIAKLGENIQIRRFVRFEL